MKSKEQILDSYGIARPDEDSKRAINAAMDEYKFQLKENEGKQAKRKSIQEMAAEKYPDEMFTAEGEYIFSLSVKESLRAAYIAGLNDAPLNGELVRALEEIKRLSIQHNDKKILHVVTEAVAGVSGIGEGKK